eukprot:jgi/Psemu1/305091/fgenesh1_kg.181_\
MSDCCIMFHHKIRSRNEVRTKRSREQSGASSGSRQNNVGIEIASVLNNANTTRNTSTDENKIEGESCSNQSSTRNRLSKPSYNEPYTNNNIAPHKEVTDESGESEDTEKGKCTNYGCSSEANNDIRQPQHEQNAQQLVKSLPLRGQQQGYSTLNEKKVCDQESMRQRPGAGM